MYQQQSPIILASKSPRRQELLKAMGLDFKVVLKEVDESYPADLKPAEIAVYIAEKKASAFAELSTDSLVITADTIVAFGQDILGKPADRTEAIAVLKQLSASVHQVYTGVSLSYAGKLHSFADLTEVTFAALTEEEIIHYVDQYQPYDKAGSYGIQEWIGLTAVEKINGSYTNVMGLPTEKLYRALAQF
jgi:septum formation protein